MYLKFKKNMEVIYHLAYGRGILLAIVIFGLIVYYFIKKEMSNISDLKKNLTNIFFLIQL